MPYFSYFTAVQAVVLELYLMLRPDYSQDIETYAWGLVLSGQTLSCVECMKFSNAREILMHVYYAG